MKKLIGDDGVYTIVIPHHIDLQTFRMELLNDKFIEYKHIEYTKPIEFDSELGGAFMYDGTTVITVESKEYDSYLAEQKLSNYVRKQKMKNTRVIVIAQLEDPSVFNLLVANLHLPEEGIEFKPAVDERVFSIPRELFTFSKLVLSVDYDIKCFGDENIPINSGVVRILKSDDFIELDGKIIRPSRII